jgi:hypothetical protein
MRKLPIAAIVAALALAALAPAAYAGKGNPSGTGLPSRSCQTIELEEGGTAPGNGHAAASPGSPFNEPEINSEEGGTGGQHYNETSQYDVACYHVSQR